MTQGICRRELKDRAKIDGGGLASAVMVVLVTKVEKKARNKPRTGECV